MRVVVEKKKCKLKNKKKYNFVQIDVGGVLVSLSKYRRYKNNYEGNNLDSCIRSVELKKEAKELLTNEDRDEMSSFWGAVG